MSKTKFVKAAVLAAIVGGVAHYLFKPKKGEQNRVKVQKASKQVIARIKKEMEQVNNITKPHYERIVNKVVRDFREDKALSKDAWDELAVILKGRWTDISNEVKTQVAKKNPVTKKTATRKKKA